MEFNRNALIIDHSNEDRELIKEKLLTASSNKIIVYSLSSRQKLTELTAQHKIKCLYVNANIGKKDLFFILKFFSMLSEKNEIETTIFIACDDYEILQEITNEFNLKNMHFLHMPLDHEDLVKKIQIATVGKIEVPTKKTSSDPLNVDLEFINVFITNTKKVLTDMAQIKNLTHSAPMLMSNIKEPLNIAISSRILISSTYFKGSYYIAFPEETFLALYNIVVQENHTKISDENKDFASELANIIYGQCKKKFSDDGLNLEMVIPSLHLGEIQYKIVIVIPFTSDLGKFYLAVAPGLI